MINEKFTKLLSKIREKTNRSLQDKMLKNHTTGERKDARSGTAAAWRN